MFTLPHTQSLIKQVGRPVAAQIYVGYATLVQHVAKSNVNETVQLGFQWTRCSNGVSNDTADWILFCHWKTFQERLKTDEPINHEVHIQKHDRLPVMGAELF